LVGTGLAAYNFGPIPVQWVAQGTLLGIALVAVLARDRLQIIPGSALLLLFLAYAALMNIVQWRHFAPLLPIGASLPYPLFISVRFINVLSFAAAYYLAYWVQTRGHRSLLIRRVVLAGLGITILAVYIYAAERLGLPQPPRTRMGTGGGEQVTGTFSTADMRYSRMLGTFREPSHLAEWLLIPLFLTLAQRGWRARAGAALMVASMLLTVSLTGILSALAGWLGGIVLLNPLRVANLKKVAVGAALILVLFFVVQNLTAGMGLSVYSVLNARTLDLIEGGIGGSNRAYVYEFMSAHPPPLLGYGLGNGNIYFSNISGSTLVNSFLSIYVSTFYSTGIVGFTLLAMFLVTPIVRMRTATGRRADATTTAILMGYLSYLVAFAVAPEELSVPFGIGMALLAFRPNAQPAPIVERPQAVAAGF
jgi:hypothetical protein